MANIVLIQQHSAWNGAKAREAQDLSLALAATEHQVRLLYRNAAVLQLLPLTQSLAIKDFTVAQKLFELYDIAAVYACQQSVTTYSLQPEQLRIDVQVLDCDAQNDLLSQADYILVL